MSFYTGWPQSRPKQSIKNILFYVHLDTKAEVSIGFANDNRSDLADENLFN